MTFRAHELVNRFPHGECRRAIEAAIKFDLGSLADFEALHAITSRSFFDIPFPVCLFQIDKGGHVFFCLARKIDEGVLWRSFSLIPGSSAMSSWSSLVYSDGRGSCNKLHDSDIAVEWEDVDKVGREVIGNLHAVANAIEVFSCCNVTTTENQPPKFINAKRIAKGKVPFFSYRTLHIMPDASETQGGVGVGTHASPRLHLRRGHIRRLADRRVWVRSSLVGDKSKGIAVKDYKVIAARDSKPG